MAQQIEADAAQVQFMRCLLGDEAQEFGQLLMAARLCAEARDHFTIERGLARKEWLKTFFEPRPQRRGEEREGEDEQCFDDARAQLIMRRQPSLNRADSVEVGDEE